MEMGILFIVIGVLLLFGGVALGLIIFFILGIVFTGIGIIMVKFSTKGSSRKKEISNPNTVEEEFQKWISKSLSQYNVSRNDMKRLYGNKYYVIKPKLKKFIYIDYSAYYKSANTKKIVDLNNVKKISLKINNKIVGEMTKENAIGRALVGGALFGTAGAIVGGASAKETQTQYNQITSIRLEIITNDVKNPYSTITLYQEKDEKQINFIAMEQNINNLYWSLENCLQENKEALN
ncbi:DUF308 domain-containing protein [Peribacillus sp. RS7]|uniref:DUF308 domain-containing protein n=1 Tax=Peribacillus sp. RS7 TaxID=3242679 RepID=UPI0035C0696A